MQEKSRARSILSGIDTGRSRLFFADHECFMLLASVFGVVMGLVLGLTGAGVAFWRSRRWYSVWAGA